LVQGNSSRGQAKLHRPATGKQPEAPAPLGVLRRVTQQKAQTKQALVPSIWPTQGGERKNSNGHRFTTTHYAWVPPQKLKTDNWQTVGECLSLSPLVTWEQCWTCRTSSSTSVCNPAGEMNTDQDGDGRLSLKCPAIRPPYLPILDGPAGPSCGEDIAPPGSSPDLVCGRHCHSERQSKIRLKESRNYSLDMQRSRFNREQKDIPINTESTGELPRPTNQSEGPDGGPATDETEQGPVNDEGLPATEEIITGAYRWDGGDIAGPAEGGCGPAWPSKMHHESGCLDALGGVCWRAYAPYCQKLIWLLKEALEALKHPVTHPIPQPPPSHGRTGGGGSGRGGGARRPNFTFHLHSVQGSCTSH